MPLASLALATPLDAIDSIRPDAARLAGLGLSSVEDLLHHYPLRHEREEAESTIADAQALVEAQDGANLAVRGTIAAVRTRRGRMTRVEATLEDETGSVLLTFFNMPWLSRRLHPGQEGLAEGKGRRHGELLQMVNPRFTPLDAEAPREARSSRIRPIYPAREDLPSARIERAVEAVLEPALALVEETLPEAYRRRRELLGLAESLRAMHRPEDLAQPARARRRLAFEELLVMQLAVAMRRHQLRSLARAPRLPLTPEIDARIRARLPFSLTPGQEGAIREISADLAGDLPMNRLLQGDVGSGKTAVALHAMLLAAAAGRQALMIAPTEILAEQHERVLRAILAASEVEVCSIVGGLPAAVRRSRLERLASGEVALVVGTHALLGESISFHDLGLVVIDEQHRFGVSQRAALRRHRGRDGTSPHVLVMTATPIPRTLSLTLLGDLDVTTIADRPPGRVPPATRVVPPARRDEVDAYLRRRLEQGEQAYVVVPAIEEGDAGLAAVSSRLASLRDGAFRGLRVEGLHGRMPAAERDLVMDRFRRREIDVLVATVVIEVGVDVPNATLMVIEHAERFGLAQLHQLRGRVARSTRRGLCVAIAEAVTPDSLARMEAFASTDDGFRIAELDLGIRGPGELFGARQSGLAPLRVADLVRDLDLLALARADAREWIERSPRLDAPGEEGLRRMVLGRYGAVLGLVEVG
ncbi:MAG: ATP-dependent DNA helicase RecG [Phycisphaerae bacterium]|nr:ATP-dependent DNA helicase RecG [Phycisphaerae bacterium]